MKKLRKNNRGVTLVELIVSTAILAIVAVAASAFMIAGTRTYSSVSYNVRLQYEAQIAMAQLQEYAVDCTDGIAWDEAWDDEVKILYIVNGSDVHMFKFDSTEQTLSYAKTAKADNLNENTIAYDLAAEHITDMDVNLSNGQAEIKLQMQRNTKTYSATQIIAMRNRPVVEDSWAELRGKI